MIKFRIALVVTALTVATVAIVACNKEKASQQETTIEQQPQNPNDYTLAEMAEAMSWEEGKAFFENQTIKDYTAVCEKVMNDCGFGEKISVSVMPFFSYYFTHNRLLLRTDIGLQLSLEYLF